MRLVVRVVAALGAAVCGVRVLVAGAERDVCRFPNTTDTP